MLRELRVKNFTIIDEITITFDRGFTVFTGETGAGKSVIVDALGLLLGERASPEYVKSGQKEALIQASFDGCPADLIRDLSLQEDEEVILRRHITSQGKTKAYVNDTRVSLQTLGAIGRSLIDLYGQHEHQGLLKRENHISFLDGLGGLQKHAGSVSALYREVAEIRGRLESMRARARDRSQRIDLLRFQIQEIDSARLLPGEREAIEQEREILLNIAKLREAAETAYSLLYGEERSCLDQLKKTVTRVREMANIDQSSQDLLNTLESAVPVVEEALIMLRGFREKYDMDPQRLVALDERREAITKLERKYGPNFQEIISYQEKASEELTSLEHIDEQTEETASVLGKKESELAALAGDLSKKRKGIAGRIEQLTVDELKQLGFQKALFCISLHTKEHVDENGIDDVEFLFSANPGEPPKPLIRVASGGELSRIMLALKCVEIQQGAKDKGHDAKMASHAPATLIFDEIDAGIGGVTAQHVGHRLRRITGDYQVLCVSHLPQIAALAENHLMVEKQLEKGGVLVTASYLDEDLRQKEIARMLSGNVTGTSLKHARELLHYGSIKSQVP